MKTCTRCHKSNPDDARYCLQCGNYLPTASLSRGARQMRWIRKMPVLGWILIAVVALVAGLGFIIGGFWAVATIAGVASIILLVCGFFLFGVYRRGNFTPNNIFRAVAIGFFALMGACVDQTGNYLYNLPIQAIACPAGTKLGRNAEVDQPYAGKTIITQDFGCYNDAGDREHTVDTFAVMGYRFVEYIILAYILIALRWLVNKFRKRKIVN